jgi:hypothetical protein
VTEAGDVANYDQTIDMEEEERMYFMLHFDIHRIKSVVDFNEKVINLLL